ncbi:MAG: pyridoxamine 5'-phosphate oxidase [Dinoroseobacter sp.]|jgi:pyridoxamine 5'-phosphate oxidase
MHNPLDKFNIWWQTALSDSPLNQKSAVCVSTINREGFPEGRFVDLKEVTERGFIFCTYFDSSKGNDIDRNPRVSLTIWWDHVGLQVRVVGLAKKISEAYASEYWATRKREAQLTTIAFNQSKPISSESELAEKYRLKSLEVGDRAITKPENWGGYIVEPISIEFLTFNENRLHLRECFKNTHGHWDKSLLQP